MGGTRLERRAYLPYTRGERENMLAAGCKSSSIMQCGLAKDPLSYIYIGFPGNSLLIDHPELAFSPSLLPQLSLIAAPNAFQHPARSTGIL